MSRTSDWAIDTMNHGGEPTVCPECDGQGWVRLPVTDHWSSGAIDDCVLCDGSGEEAIWDNELCYASRRTKKSPPAG